MRKRISAIGALAAVALAVAACESSFTDKSLDAAPSGGAGGAEADAAGGVGGGTGATGGTGGTGGTTGGTGGTGGEAADAGADAAPDGPPPIIPSVTVNNQTLGVSTTIFVNTVTAGAPGFITIHETGLDGAVGAAIGHAAVDVGVNADIDIVVERPVVDQETLHAMLHIDAGEAGVYEFPDGPDVPVLDGAGVPIMDPFLVDVPAGTPAVLLTLTNVGTDAYRFLDGFPEPYASEAIGDEAQNQTLAFRPGWRYEIHNTSTDAHPFEFITDNDPGANTDLVQTSQTPDEGALEADPTVAYEEVNGGQHIRFTVSDAFAAAVDGYRCANHTASMRGVVDFGDVTPAIEVADQLLALSTVVTLVNAASNGPGLAVVSANDGPGGPGTILGAAGLHNGNNRDALVVLSRPAQDAETLHVALHHDAGEPGIYEPELDLPVLGPDDGPVGGHFVAQVPEGTPAVRLDVRNNNAASYNFIGGEPYEYADAAIGDTANNQALTLERGWRYEIVNTGRAAHPFELVTDGAPGPNEDVPQASQSANRPLEADPRVEWAEDGNAVRFTVTEAFAAAITAYRCANHPATMRGLVGYSGIPPAPRFNSMTVSDEPLVVSTLIAMGPTETAGPSLVAMFADNDGSAGDFLGVTSINGMHPGPGFYVSLSRPAVDGETLHAVMLVDAGMIGYYEPELELPAVDPDGNPVEVTFGVTIPPGTPAVRIVLGNQGTDAYVAIDGAPTDHVLPAIGGIGALNPTLTLRPGWRYRIENSAGAANHPFDFTDAAGQAQLSQTQAGALELDPTIGWTESGDDLTFTVSETFAAIVTGYQCEFHPESMNGTVSIVP